MVQRLFTAWKVMAHESRYGPVRIVLSNIRCGVCCEFSGYTLFGVISGLYRENDLCLHSNTLVWLQQADSSNICGNCLNSLNSTSLRSAIECKVFLLCYGKMIGL